VCDYGAGCMIDSYAREHLWAIGKDFIHGVGHGVGAALNVHEGPHRISRVLDPQPLVPGMVVSNEPGYYENGNFGIRIENLLVVKERPDLGIHSILV
jgi:Xaa-Pro aminopeptidase